MTGGAANSSIDSLAAGVSSGMARWATRSRIFARRSAVFDGGIRQPRLIAAILRPDLRSTDESAELRTFAPIHIVGRRNIKRTYIVRYTATQAIVNLDCEL
jgi:hypothetical protein